MGRDLGDTFRQLAEDALFLLADHKLLGAQQPGPVAGPGQPVRVAQPIPEALCSSLLSFCWVYRTLSPIVSVAYR